MKKVIFVFALLASLSACESHQAEPYQKDRSVESRDEYNGFEGMDQYQKDELERMKTDKSEACQQAQIDLAKAESEGDAKRIKRLKALVEDVCN
ncbi:MULTISPECIES: hypothetical protein [Idiomarina]|jgi:hypothetical protein|uniref:DUF1090 domain-containing protein n=2 Tax=Idiomarina baltica TaxID=190892 RepID=A0A348WMQ1_9GAMM|nr:MULTISPECIES: hypothetical protein [Idiomarina]MAF74449.1 hypothetical protein [Idiomarinaceae bacterium]MEC8925862.1 hypothetical protein [Pseudomonadota bacterium]EAQ31955.1 hypothetical protein OS145_11711 [Idiomarina baltica OS145]KXS34564.1 MAG: putative lipoprotein [Idiomarina sp. T82-3]MBL74855.1 hypothetical protein [Idiomarinaceae bacterium]|tara:strand:- start:1574 stop:1855 length:282 start_codon:yes stop_codon:yes gene_type:complete